ncbi:MAG: dTDP-4-dehydrorhamnose 3,5-epimerase [Bacteroidia bacterium]
MELTETQIKGLVIIQPKVFQDGRGYFYEPYNKKTFSEMGINDDFLQDNQSMSQKGVVRGLHFQNPPFAQSKLVRVIQGAVWDVVVDIRKNSPTYGKYFGIELNAENMTILYIPEGFAHGFKTLEDNTVFLYKCSAYYNKPSEDSIRWNDKDINIPWDIENPVLSEKDKNAKLFRDFKSLF